MARIKKQTKKSPKHEITDVGMDGYGEKGTCVHCWWECKLQQPVWKTGWRLLRKCETEIPLSFSNSTTGCLLVQNKNITLKGTYIPMFTAALFLRAKEGSNLSVHEWVKM